MVRFHTPAVILTIAACGSGPAGSKPPPAEPPPAPIIAPVLVDAAVDAPEPPRLACESGASPMPAPLGDPTWHCTRDDGTRHGAFVRLYPDDTIELRGEYKDGVLDGAWERRAASGAVVEAGTYAGGLKHGTWRQVSSRGTTLGDYEMAAGTGIEKRWYDDGPLYSETGFKAGVRHGSEKIYLRDGTLLSGTKFTAGKIDGPHVFGTHKTLRFEETFVDGVRRGARKIFHLGLLLAEESFDKQGRPTGMYTLWRSAKIARVKGRYVAGKRTGEWVWLDRDGKKEREGSYLGGRRHGDWFEWVEDNLVWAGSYSNGRPYGTFTYFAKSGAEIGHYTMRDGTGYAFTYHGNGKPATKTYLIKGVEAGPYQELTRAGKVVVQGGYSGGKKHGEWKEWTPDGVLMLEEAYDAGRLDGVVKKYVDGKLATQSTYKLGAAHGAFIEHRGDRPAVTGQFANDVRTGTWTHYNADGAVVRTATYKDGVLDGPYRELADGVVIEGQMVAGRRTGTWQQTDKAGAVRKLAYRAP